MRYWIIILLGLFFPMLATAQTDVALDPEFGGRISFTIDKKIVRRLHVSLEEEVRFDNNFGAFDRLQSTLSLNYKIHPNIKIGAGYALINGYSSSSNAFKNARHRFMIDVKGTLKYGNWNLSLKERMQLTHRTGDYNVYQNPANALMLKSRLTAKYLAAYDGINYGTVDGLVQEGDPGWFLGGFNGSYINRYRGSLGVDILLNRSSTLNFYFMGDYCIDKEVDANAEGTILKSYTKETGFRVWLGAGYEFSF